MGRERPDTARHDRRTIPGARSPLPVATTFPVRFRPPVRRAPRVVGHLFRCLQGVGPESDLKERLA
ncbi:hypothetical protein MILUP08_45028 [Micromonospora lupini str. Lupac 08]|uniref:Uncharacterized protein n=1 Tax=Micromonospora lupini str. Lupac 08 TaxID=1150864 RepID=I0L8K1_9ACTN|nr:hypothetical protein MILUP08_45028 [Micromonospora lupini str. Lupac 08]